MLKYFSTDLKEIFAMPRPSFNRTTLTEVARKAGVSSATASAVLSGKGDEARIAATTAERVRAVALDLDYSPNLLVRTIQKGTSGVLAVFSAFRVIEDDDLYMDRLSRALEKAAGQRGYDLLLHCAYDRTAEETYRSINGGRADGLLLFAPHADDPVLALMRRSRLPCVLLNARDAEGVLPSVKDDYRTGMRDVAERLSALGHRRIACLHVGPIESPDAFERIDELDRALESFGVLRPSGPTLDVSGRLTSALQSLMALPEPPTAIFCCTDRLAYRTLDGLEQMGQSVPRDVSLVGYDGIRWPCESRHRVASVVVDLKVQATAAVNLLLERGEAPTEITIATIFDPGTTLGPASTSQRSPQ